GTVTDNATGACVYQKTYVDVNVSGGSGVKILSTDSLEVKLLPGGAISFKDPATDITLLNANPFSEKNYEKIPKEKITYDENSARMEETANGKVTVKDILRRDTIGYKERFQFSFTAPADEAIYGLGSHMEDYMDLTGKTLWLTQHNLKAFVPMIVSTSGFGLLIDAGCSMKFESKLLGDKSLAGKEWQLIDFTLEAAKTIDYYFIKGNPQEVVADYRFLTGNVSMMPRYLFGYTQSKERYVSSDDIVNTLKEYRRRHVPIDMIVQDWNYWPQGWGYMRMNREYYPDPKALADSVHAYDGKLMISIWDNPQYCPEEEDFRNRGFMLEHSVYDAFNPKARDLYWEYADNEFFNNGFDAWWCDSSEPLDGDWNQLPPPENGKPYSWDDHERRWRLNDEVLSETLGAERACLYSLNHAKGIYDHQRAATDKKRVVNLTRSTWAGQQRYGTIVWNGDTHASWDSFRQQIPAGLNYFATGNPYWT
ncbi:MAG: alpha-glucosidase, partial [Muribaculaceae bacterium]|nr:alpha-glucosidase [Muribaculaceae bacterium]